jgi:DNA-binding response OmpR family regulator
MGAKIPGGSPAKEDRMNRLKKVVVVDDDLKVTTLVEKALTQKGFQVFTATEGKKALELVENEKPDLLITDILQPGHDGVSLCNLIKQDISLCHIKVIIISGVYNETNFKLLSNCSPDGFIEKPIDVKRLADMILEKINQGSGNADRPDSGEFL